METWNSDAVHLIRTHVDGSVDELTVACKAVTWAPTPDIPDNTERSEPGYLLVQGAHAPALDQLDWQPTQVRFAIEGYTEDRQFEVTGWHADPDDAGAGRFKLYLPWVPPVSARPA